MLVTKPDFYHKETREQLFRTIAELLQLNIIPIFNTNDAVDLDEHGQLEEATEGKSTNITDKYNILYNRISPPELTLYVSTDRTSNNHI